MLNPTGGGIITGGGRRGEPEWEGQGEGNRRKGSYIGVGDRREAQRVKRISRNK